VATIPLAASCRGFWESTPVDQGVVDAFEEVLQGDRRSVLGKCLSGPNGYFQAPIFELSAELVEVVAGGPGSSHRVGAAILTTLKLFLPPLLLSAPECTTPTSSELRSDNPYGAAGNAA